MKKHRLHFWDGIYYLIPVDNLRDWNSFRATNSFDFIAQYEMLISDLVNLDLYLPDGIEGITTIFDIEAIKKEQKQVMQILTETQNELSGYELRKQLVLALIASNPAMSVTDTLTCIDKFIKYIQHGNGKTT